MENTSIKGMHYLQLDGIVRSRVTCRPGMGFDIHTVWSSQAMVDVPCIEYKVRVQNSYHPDDHVDLSMHVRMPDFVETVDDFLDLLLGIALWFDEHEGREWFKVDGRPYLDPHNAWGSVVEPFDARTVFDHVRALRTAAAAHS